MLTKQQRSFRQQKRIKSKHHNTSSRRNENIIYHQFINHDSVGYQNGVILPLTEVEVKGLLDCIQNMTTIGVGIFLRYFTSRPEVILSDCDLQTDDTIHLK